MLLLGSLLLSSSFCFLAKTSYASNVCAKNALGHLLYGPGDVLQWLNDLEFGEDVAKEESRPPLLENLENLKCRKDCNQSNCCAFLQYGKSLKVKRLNENTFKFNYHNDSMHILATMKNGYWNGIIKGFERWFMTMNMTILANFHQGQLQGPVWRLLEENGYLVADNLQMTGTNVLYIYPGLHLGLRGLFHNGEMLAAKPVIIKGFKCIEGGIMEPQWEFMSGNSNVYSFDPAKKGQLSKEPLLRDPLEEYFVEVRPSTIKNAGDGVFMRRDVRKNTIVAFFNGIHITLEDTFRHPEMKASVHKMWNDWENDTMLYIPKELININVYNASSGHKINHNSDFNVDAGYIDHPRFGRIRSIVTTKNLKAGDEIFCQYANTVDSTTFVRQVFKDFSEYLDIKDDDIRLEFLEKMQVDYKFMLESMKHDPDKRYWKP